jgi:hypothetical protein
LYNGWKFQTKQLWIQKGKLKQWGIWDIICVFYLWRGICWELQRSLLTISPLSSWHQYARCRAPLPQLTLHAVHSPVDHLGIMVFKGSSSKEFIVLPPTPTAPSVTSVSALVTFDFETTSGQVHDLKQLDLWRMPVIQRLDRAFDDSYGYASAQLRVCAWFHMFYRCFSKQTEQLMYFFFLGRVLSQCFPGFLFFCHWCLLPIGWRNLQIIRQRQRKITNAAPSTLSQTWA